MKNLVKKTARYILHEDRAPVNLQVAVVAPNEQLAGRKIAIVGGSKGIGRAIAKRLCKMGAEVLIVGRDEASLSCAIADLGGKGHYLRADISEASCAGELIERARTELDGLDSIVLSAGISLHEESFREVTPESFDAQISINLKGTFFLVKEFFLYAESHHVHDANCLIISSETGDEGSERPYGLSKAALNSLVAGMSRRVCRNNMRINALSPGVTATSMVGYDDKMLSDKDLDYSTNDFASGRIFLTDEVAEVAAFLLSPVSQCISGEIIHCNRGNHLAVSRYIDDEERWNPLCC